MKKITLLFILGLTLSLFSAKAQNTSTLPDIGSPDVFGDYDLGDVKYTACRWSSANARIELNKVGSGTGAGSIQWYADNGVGYVTNTTNKDATILVNGVEYGTVGKGLNVEVYLEQQHGDKDTIVILNATTKIPNATQVIWTDFVDGTTVIDSISAIEATALNTKDVSSDVAKTVLTFSLNDETNTIPTIISGITLTQNEIVPWVDVFRFLEAEIVNRNTSEKIPVHVHNAELRLFPDGYEIADGDSVAFDLNIWIKEGISTDLLHRMQVEGAQFTFSMGLASIILDAAGDQLSFDPSFTMETGTFTFLTEATTVSLLKREPLIQASKPAYLVVAATDANSVVDTSAAVSGKTTTLALSKVSGPGDITSATGLSQVCTVDTAWVEFSDIVFSAAGTYEVQIEATGDFTATSTFTVNVTEALLPVIEWTDFTDTVPTASTPANADRSIIHEGTFRNVPKTPELSYSTNNWMDSPVESFGFLVNTEGVSSAVLSQRLSVSGPNSPDSLKIQFRVINAANPIDWTDLSGVILTGWDAYDAQYIDGLSLPAEAVGKDSVEIRYLCLSTNNFHGEPGKTGASIKVWDLAIYGGSLDDTAPVLSDVTTGPVTVGEDISATSNEAGMIYLVPAGTTGDAATIAAAAVSSATATAATPATLSTSGIDAADYIVYAVDGASNVSDASADITVNAAGDDTPPVLSDVTVGPVTVGDDISATSNEDGMIYLVLAGTTGDAAAIVDAAVVSATATADVAAILSTTGIDAADYIVYAIDAADNVSAASADITVEAGVGLNNNSANKLNIYPNPVVNSVNIDGVQISEAIIFSITGNAIEVDVYNNSIDVSGLNAGIYMIKVTDNNGELFIARFVKN